MPIQNSWQAVFAINQNTSVADLQRLANKIVADHVLVLTTHRTYPTELNQLMSVAQKVEVATFSDFLTEQEMLDCDNNANKEIESTLETLGRRRYFSRFMAASRRLKNKKVLENVRQRCPGVTLFHADGLGIDSAIWKEFGSESIGNDNVQKENILSSIIRQIKWKLSGEINVIRDCDSCRWAIFLGSVNRITFRTNVYIFRVAWPFDWSLTNPVLNASLLCGLLRARGISNNYEIYTSIHQYCLPMSQLAEARGKLLRILVDGHHPSNYPASYIGMFGSGEFASANPLSADWFWKHGRRVIPGSWFQAVPHFQRCTCIEIHCVILVLNHAGDWSALINRSDTDLLISAFIELADYNPNLEFVIRLHPTMATIEHEGLGAARRIGEMVDRGGHKNLSISVLSLNDDLSRGDLYFSEYSQVLIDAWAAGKLGAAVNLTHRRSFMVDYEKLGFATISSQENLKRFFEQALTSLDEIVDAQNLAVDQFNETWESWQNIGNYGNSHLMELTI